MKQGSLLRPVLAACCLFASLPAFAAGGDGATISNMPNRISMNCTTPSGKAVTDPAECAKGGCVDPQGKPVTDTSVCTSPPSNQPAPAQGTVVKSKSNITNN
ncbi:MAG: hypothetical protein AB7O49_14935 [Sphingomonadales bacterium]